MSKVADLDTHRPPPIASRVYRADGQWWVNEAYLDNAVREAVEHADQAHGSVGLALVPTGTFTIDQVRALLLRLGHPEGDMWLASNILEELRKG